MKGDLLGRRGDLERKKWNLRWKEEHCDRVVAEKRGNSVGKMGNSMGKKGILTWNTHFRFQNQNLAGCEALAMDLPVQRVQ